MKIKYCCSKTDSELKQILQLQALNLPGNRREETLAKEGFVTVKHDLELLREMQGYYPHILAKSDNILVGYALSMHPVLKGRIAVLKSLFATLEKIKGSGFNNFVVMGQVCIAKEFRGMGIFRGLYQKMRKTFPGQPIITEVDEKNQRSFQAHQAIGFKTLAKHTDDGHHWNLLIWE